MPELGARHHPAPSSVYGATKLAQEHVLAAWGGSHDVPLSVLRLQNVYGPGQSLTNPYTGIVSLFSQLARDGRSIPLYEDGEITRDFVYIDDVVSALVAAAGRAAATPVRAPSTSARASAPRSATWPTTVAHSTTPPSRTSPASSATATSGTPPATCSARSTSSPGSRSGRWPTGWPPSRTGSSGQLA